MVLRLPHNSEPVRLDKYLKKSVPELTRGGMFTALRKGRIRVNGVKSSDGREELHPGDTIEIEGFDPARETGRRLRMDSEILYEDDWLLVVNKPKGISVHPGDEKHEITLIDTLREYGRGKAFVPHLVHRLDKYTSGVLITAKRKDVAVRLGKVFRRKEEGDLRKVYAAVVFGKPMNTARIDTPLEGKRAVTSYTLIASRPWKKTAVSLLSVEIVTGRTHQIRRHLAENGIPVIGDDMYGNWDLNREFAREYRYKDYALHCMEIDIRHPETGSFLQLQAHVPEDMRALVKPASSE